MALTLAPNMGLYTISIICERCGSGPDTITFGADYKAEYLFLCETAQEISKNFTFMRPLGLTETTFEGNKLTFITEDLEGNKINSEELFAGHKVTMINIWSTTCSVCLTEIPVLEKMNQQYAEYGSQIVGLLYDGDEEIAAKEAKEFLHEYDITYSNIIANQQLKDYFPTQSFPMTYFFDENGSMIGNPVIGASIERYQKEMENLLTLPHSEL